MTLYGNIRLLNACIFRGASVGSINHSWDNYPSQDKEISQLQLFSRLCAGQLHMSGSVISHACCNTLYSCSAWTFYFQLPMAGTCIKEEEKKDNRRKLAAPSPCPCTRTQISYNYHSNWTRTSEYGSNTLYDTIKEIVDVFVLPKTLNWKEPNHWKFYTCICRETML
jgi:hypothetical protein